MAGEAGRQAGGVGTVYGVLFNDAATVARWQDAFRAPPYRSPPAAPVLYVKPRNTFAANGSAVAVPPDAPGVRVDATLGAVVARRATAVAESDAAAFVAGWVVVADLALLHASVHRPAIRQRCRDGFCPIGEMRAAAGIDPHAATIAIAIDGETVHRRASTALVRPLPRLLADVTSFMTLDAGDVLLLGAPDDTPVAAPGSRVEIVVDGFAPLAFTVVAEEAP